jgi:opacity protein-like surface antigen
MMKSLVAVVALAAVVATPALAQTASRRGQLQPGQAQYNGSYERSDGQRHSSVPSNDVYENGRYVGSDPDPTVRLEMQRDNHQGD